MGELDVRHRREPRTGRWDRARGWWSSAQWLLLAGVALVSFVLGYVGFRRYYQGLGVAQSPSDLAYLAFQLFALESGAIAEGGTPWQLDVARLAAPATTATALVAGALAVFREQVVEWRLRRSRRHVVVCGLGVAGTSLAGDLIDAGHRVVALEPNRLDPAIGALRRRGAAVIVGDPCDPGTLARAHLDRASHLIALLDRDDANAEIALRAAELVAERTGPGLDCFAHIDDPDLCALLRTDEIAAAHETSFRLDFFNVDDRAARALVHDHPPVQPRDPDVSTVAVVGASRMGRSLIVELARWWRGHADEGAGRLRVLLLDIDAAGVVARLGRRRPDVAEVVELVALATEPGAVDVDESVVRAGTVYVCADDQSVAVKAALRARRRLLRPGGVVVVAMRGARAMGDLIERSGSRGDVAAFDVFARTMGPELLLGGTYEVLARAIHDEYLAEHRRRPAAERGPSTLPWEELPDSLKESNRDQAAHIGAKLAAVGRTIIPLGDDVPGVEAFTEDEVERLAEMEHERWVHQRRRDGWVAGPKDVAGKTTPYLVPWRSLSEEVKELDRQAVRRIPDLLAEAGYQAVGAVR